MTYVIGVILGCCVNFVRYVKVSIYYFALWLWGLDVLGPFKDII